ncbi:hypothetical protein I8H83_00355 [Candidatus Saccharibacteria bacterium]|nr:hypothetical protein [Candidatus Saccharibacteria bacterium]MBH2007040.1 hypothetical protein [Candidatus Saccharibacteria bacterium]
MPIPILEVKGTSKRIFEAKNETGRTLLGLVDASQKIFPEDSNWISRNWEIGYRIDGKGFKQVISHLDAVSSRSRTPQQNAHLNQMRDFARDTWH